MASPKELRDLEEDRPVYAPEDDSHLSVYNRRRQENESYVDRIRNCSSKNIRTGVIVFLLCCLLFGLFVATALPRIARSSSEAGGGHHAELPPPEHVKFFMVGMRHGNRNPGKFMKGDTSYQQWAWEGPSMLTNIGKRQAASLGAFLRKRYDRLVPDNFFPFNVKAYSSSAERCQQTLQSCMSGFFPPKGRSIWSTSLNWQPIPYEISDPLLRMYNVKCPHYDEAYQSISDDTSPAASEWLKKDPQLVEYIAKNSGMNATLSDLADVADNIMNMKMLKVPLPKWVTHPDLDGYPPKDMTKAILSFAEAHQVLCANDSACARIMSGMWLDQIIQTFQQHREGKLKGRVAHFYAAHTETVLSLIRLMKAEDVEETPTSAGFILEYTDVPTPSVRFIFHEPHPDNPDVRLAEFKSLPYCDGEGSEWCKLDTFVENNRAPAFSDWQAACKLPKCPV